MNEVKRDDSPLITDPSKIEELGLCQGINEVIVTTELDGRPNAAPIGIIKKDESLKVKLFLGTHTYENVLATGTLVANVTHDPYLFVEAALSELPLSSFQRRDGFVTLKDAESWALLKCSPYPCDIIIANLDFVKGEVMEKKFRAVNRGVGGVIEACIAATRYWALRTDSYLEEIRRQRRIVDRCGGPREREAMDRLVELLGDAF
jgi:hypothetical protein